MKKRVIPLFLALTMAVSMAVIPASAATFTDVPDTHWAYSYVEAMAEKGAVSGVGNGKFAPDKEVTYAEFAVMLSQLMYPAELKTYQAAWTGNGETNYWWEPYVDLLSYEHEVLVTMRAGVFTEKMYWEDNLAAISCNRYDMAWTMYKILQDKGVTMPSAAEQSAAAAEIADYASIPENYREPVTAMYAMGCLSGVDSKGTFGGDTSMNRAAACVVLCRLLENA